MKRHSFRLPASTSNLGAGFDALGLALQKYLYVSVEVSSTLSIDARGVSMESIPTGPDNLIVKVAQTVAKDRNRELPAFKMLVENEIPLARGLGSSAAAILAGITCYEMLTQDRLGDDEIFRYALQFESHPDNLAAALYGGLVSAATTTNSVQVARLEMAPGTDAVAVIPEYELSTARARAVLPESYSRTDAIYNIQRSALTVAALTAGKWSILREAMRDRVHQPYRQPLVPGLAEILELEIPDLLGIALSGAGPTVFAITKKGAAAKVGEHVVAVFAKHGVKASAIALTVDLQGRVITDLTVS